MPVLGRLLSLLGFFTGIPVGGGSLEEAAKAFYAVPVIGLIEALLTWVALSIVYTVTGSPQLAGLAYIASHILVTGGLHLDGLADYSDVIGSRLVGSNALRVLKDPRKGAFATIAVTLVLLAGYASVVAAPSHLGGIPGLTALLLAYSSASEAMFLVLALGPLEPYSGLGRVFGEEARRTLPENIALYAAIVLPTTMAPALYHGGWKTLTLVISMLAMALSTTIIVVMAVVRDSSKRLGFVNGDVAGFAYEVVRTMNLVLSSSILLVLPIAA